MKKSKKLKNKYMKKIMLIAVLLLAAGVNYGQTSRIPSKIGYVDYASLRDTLPETDTAELEIQMATYQFQQQIGEMQKEMQTLANRIDTSKNAELVDYLKGDLKKLDQKLNQAYQQAEYVIGELQQEAVERLNFIITSAVTKVAKAKGYTIVFDSSSGTIVYGMPQDDLTKDVAQSLKIKI
jgi:outer membrane protein